ncbi:hypothetical protein [Kitasatospora sp. NPDC101183]|uniref:hypothetical protein n=1 Tax=Kitasatospora sp. NPDC101183 TaxID=3364100 RepID=UPI00382EBFDE
MINIQVRGDGDEVLVRARDGVRWSSAFGDALVPARFPLLSALIPYGDAMFNQRQVPRLLVELGELPEACVGPWVEETRELCRFVEDGPHRYLWFVGD